MHKKIGNHAALKRAFESVKINRGLEPDEFTTNDFIKFCQESGVTLKPKTVNEKLRNLVASGHLECREVVVNSVKMNAYRETGKQ